MILAGDRHQPFQWLTIGGNVPPFLLSLLATSNLGNLEARKAVEQKSCGSRFQLAEYAETKGIYMKINYVNADHVHVLVDLPTGVSIEELVQLLKGSSSHWINANNVRTGKFAWARGYGAFSVSESNVAQVAAYIAAQEQHHRLRTFADELKEFVERHGLRLKEESR